VLPLAGVVPKKYVSIVSIEKKSDLLFTFLAANSMYLTSLVPELNSNSM
jgi:hypothetical protein